MNEKILIKLIVPEIEEKYDLFIPINRRIGSIINLLNIAISELSNNVFETRNNRFIYNKQSGNIYSINDIIRQTDIRNGTELIFI